MTTAPPSLPVLTDKPMRHPNSCISLSEPLLATLKSVLEDDTSKYSASISEPALLLSIGSGTGLLEELLHTYLLLAHQHPSNVGALADSELASRRNASSPPPPPPPPPKTLLLLQRQKWRIEGVEVSPAVNIYLPEDRMNHAAGTWAVLSRRARDAAALMFVYPRDGGLVQRYIAEVTTPSSSSSSPFSSSSADTEEQKDRGNDGSPHEDNEDEDEEEEEEEEAADNSSSDPNNNNAATATTTTTTTTTSQTRASPRTGPRLILWLGPRCDWDTTGFASLSGTAESEWEVREMLLSDGAGLAEYEMLAALRPKMGR